MDYPAHDIGVAATRFERAMVQAVGDALVPFGLSPSQYGVLDHVSSNPGVSNADLARYLLMTPQALGRLTRTLTDQGYVATSVSRAQRRQPLELTDAGARLYARTRPAIELALRGLFADLTAGEQQRLRSLLQTVADASPHPDERRDADESTTR